MPQVVSARVESQCLRNEPSSCICTVPKSVCLTKFFIHIDVTHCLIFHDKELQMPLAAGTAGAVKKAGEGGRGEEA